MDREGPKDQTAVLVTEVTRVYPGTRRVPARTALDKVSLSIPEGQWVALLGPNGSGKSTLLRIIATLDRPGAGALRLLGAEVHGVDRGRLAQVRAQMGVAFQSPGLDRLLSVRENLELAGAVYGLSSPDRRVAIERYAGLLGVSERLADRVGALSGGLVRRVDLARAMLNSPSLLLLDEPTGGLDLAARAEFLGACEKLRAGASKDRPLTIVMSTHMMDEAERADRVVLMHQGRIVADGSPGALRRELGGVVVRVRSPEKSAAGQRATAILAQHGWSVSPEPGGVIAGRCAASPEVPDRVRASVGELLALSVPVEVGPPTLGDVYLARTGASLGESVSDGPGGER